MPDSIPKVELKSKSITEEQKEKLRQLFPEVFTEDKIDWEQLQSTLGAEIETGKERFGLTWRGKAECFRIIQEPSVGTLKPVKEDSIDWDTTDNLFIQGDNLETLKLLQKSYYGKVKMIYIDPPYNTGNEFIYPDKYSESLETYLAYTGQVDSEGKKFSTNTEIGGRYHSNWLNMMYPRLFLARNLLKEDGVIFISIDDHEVHNLREMMNEIYGEENLLGIILWKKKTNGNNMGYIPPVHDYILCYAKNASDNCLLGFPLDQEYLDANYSNPDNDPRGDWTTSDLSANHKGPHFQIINPKTKEVHYPPKGRYWVFGEAEVKHRIQDGRIIFGKTGTGKPVQKKFLSERDSMRKKAESWWDEHGLNEDGTGEIAELLGPKVFDNPKPSITLKHLCNISTKENDLILDFFAGSGSIAHAIYELNEEDNGNRNFILVQLPEKTSEDSEAFKAGFKTISDLAKERVRKVIQKIKKSTKEAAKQRKLVNKSEKSHDLGFRVFKLDISNFKVWDGKIPADGKIGKKLEDFIDNLHSGGSHEDILYELLLKSGFTLTTPVKERKIAGISVYSVNEGALIICLESQLTKDLIMKIAEMKPARVICLDAGFNGNDQLKTNAAEIMRSHEIQDFRTV